MQVVVKRLKGVIEPLAASANCNLQNATGRFGKEQWAQLALILLADKVPDEDIRRATYTFEELVVYCSYNNAPCHR